MGAPEAAPPLGLAEVAGRHAGLGTPQKRISSGAWNNPVAIHGNSWQFTTIYGNLRSNTGSKMALLMNSMEYHQIYGSF